MSVGPDIPSAALGAVLDARPPLVRAAFGDLGALREMAGAAYAAVCEPDASAALCYMEAITFARIASAQGESEDARTLMFLLSTFASFWRAGGDTELETHFEGQALHLAETIADDGDDEVADMVVATAHLLPAAVHLKARQLSAEPDAVLLLEGDHLHVTFPEWYGAPVLGGAKAAGLRNPMASR